MNPEIVIQESASYYAWTVYVDGEYLGWVVPDPSGGYICPRTRMHSDPNHMTFPTVEAAAQYIHDTLYTA
jgi:hypothetical protein